MLILFYKIYQSSSIKAAYENLFQTYQQMITKRNSLFINYSFDTSLSDKDETDNLDEVKNIYIFFLILLIYRNWNFN